jgi:hypothetical protein
MAMIHTVKKIGRRYQTGQQPLVVIDSNCTFDKVQERALRRLFRVSDLFVWHALYSDSFFEWLSTASLVEKDYERIAGVHTRYRFRGYHVFGPVFAQLHELLPWLCRVNGLLVTQNPAIIDKADYFRVTTPLSALHYLKQKRRM